MISLGIDIGGTGVKCVAFDEKATQLALSYREYPVESGTVNLPPDILWKSTCQVISECVAALPDPSSVVAITVSSFGESFVSIDTDGNALTDILMYFGDSSSDSFDKLVRETGERKFMQIARILPDASYSLAKMLYTREVAGDKIWKFVFIAGYVCYKLSGRVISDIPLACRSLLYDVEKRDWSDELLEASGISRDMLPEVKPAGTVAGNILPELAVELGLNPDVRIVIGSHDQIVNALGAGVSGLGEAVDTSGTCECVTPLFGALPESLDFQRNNFACVPYLNTGGYVTYAYNISAGSVVRWLRDIFKDTLEKEASERGCGVYQILNTCCDNEPGSMLMLPFLQGMGGTPDVDPSATGCIMGLTTSTRLPDLYKAVVEGITFEMRYNQEKLAEGGVVLRKLFACGGGAKSPVWMQIKADILGCDIYPVLAEETGAMGSAILGFAAVTGGDPMQLAASFCKTGEPLHPDARRQAIYDKKYNMYKTLRNFYMEQRKIEKQL